MIENYYHEKDPDGRSPSCYLLTYRGCKYWHCYEIHITEWFEKVFNKREDDN
jgi:hypothetical protein